MSVTSKTGLLLTTKNVIHKKNKDAKPIEFKNIASPAPFILRPFADLYNPFPYGCSVLCNHPADCEAKGIVKRAKQAWATELRANAMENRRLHKLEDGEVMDSEEMGAVPEELFRRYTDTDSRPLTPAPTLTSILTSSVGGRRCVTPDPTPCAPSAERTLLVLDLRRSQSHETLTWPEEKFEQPTNVVQSQPRSQTPSSISSKSRVSSKKSKKSVSKKESPEKSPVPKADPVPEILKAHIKAENEKLQLPTSASAVNKDQSGTSSDKEDEGVMKRRGKPRKNKRKKTSKENSSSELDREFKGLAEPGETQMSAFASESRVGSGRHSMSAASAAPAGVDDHPSSIDGEGGVGGSGSGRRGGGCDAADRVESTDEMTSREGGEWMLDEGTPISFIQPEILKHLQRELDIEVVENEFNIRKQKALAEALRMNAMNLNQKPNHEMRAVRSQVGTNVNSAQSLLTLPRTFSRQSARFELPLDTSSLESMTPLEYINQHIIVTRDRRLFYNLVFEYNREREEDDDGEEGKHLIIRNMTVQKIKVALGQIMGRQLSDDDFSEFERLVGWSEVSSIDFRTWSGVSALYERLLGPKYCTKYPSKDEDRCHDIEKADFNTLPRKLKNIKVNPRLTEILMKIKDSG